LPSRPSATLRPSAHRPEPRFGGRLESVPRRRFGGVCGAF
jgi:hypothetical protein